MEIFFVLQGETVAAGTLVGVSGQKQLDTSPTLTNNITTQPDDLDLMDDPLLDIQNYQSKTVKCDTIYEMF